MIQASQPQPLPRDALTMSSASSATTGSSPSVRLGPGAPDTACRELGHTEARVTILGLEGTGKTTFTVLALFLLYVGQSRRWRVNLGDGTPACRTLSTVPADAELVLSGENLPMTNTYVDLAFTVHPRTHEPDAPGALVRWLDPQGRMVKTLLQDGRTEDPVLGRLRQSLDDSVGVIVVMDPTSRNFPGQVEVFLRALDQIAPRFGRRSRFEHVSITLLVTHWGSFMEQSGGSVENFVEQRFPGAMTQITALRETFRIGVFGVEARQPAAPGARFAFEPVGVLEATDFVLEGVFHAERQRRRARRDSWVRRAAPIVVGVVGLLGVASGLTLARDDRAVQRARRTAASCAPDDVAGRRQAWLEVRERRLLPATFGALEPGQREADLALDELEREPARRAFLAVTAAPPAVRLQAAARFLQEHGEGPLAGPVRGVTWEALDALCAPGGLPAEIDPEEVLRAARAVLGGEEAGAARLAHATGRLESVAGERAGQALLAAWDERLLLLAAGGDAGAPLPEEQETQRVADTYPRAAALRAVRTRMSWLRAVRAARAVTSELQGDPEVERIDQLAASVSDLSATCVDGPFEAELRRLSSELARRRQAKIQRTLRELATAVNVAETLDDPGLAALNARLDDAAALCAGTDAGDEVERLLLELGRRRQSKLGRQLRDVDVELRRVGPLDEAGLAALEARVEDLAGPCGGTSFEPEVRRLREDLVRRRLSQLSLTVGQTVRELATELARTEALDDAALAALDARLSGLDAPCVGTRYEADLPALRDLLARRRADTRAVQAQHSALATELGLAGRGDVEALAALGERLARLGPCAGALATERTTLRTELERRRDEASLLRTLHEVAAELAQLAPGDVARLDALSARLALITPVPASPLDVERSALQGVLSQVRQGWAAAAEPADGLLVSAGRDHDRLEEDALVVARAARSLSGDDATRHWQCVSWLLSSLDRRVHTQQDRRIVLPTMAAFRELEAAARDALRLDPSRSEDVRRLLEHDLPRSVGFRCPRCSNTSVQCHAGCGDAVGYRAGQVVCVVHTSVVISRRVCRDCGFVWRDP